MARAWLCVVGLAAPALALAGEQPAFNVDDKGFVVGDLTVDAPLDQVRKIAYDIQHSNSNSNVLKVEFKPDGNCQAVTRVTRGLFSPLTMQTRLCPTALGWSESLVKGDYGAYESEWIVRPVGSRTHVQIRVRSEVSFAPTALVQRGTIHGIREAFDAIVSSVAKNAPAAQ